MANGRDILTRTYPDGSSIYAWLEDFDGDPQIQVHWRDPSGKPRSQPFRIDLSVADRIFEQLAGFARELQVIEAEE